MEAELQKLISEYCAIEKMDRIVPSATQRGQTELIGLRVRELRRREILLELTKWIIVAEDLLKQVSHHDERDIRTQGVDLIRNTNSSP